MPATSAARLLANRRNALASTGPKTLEGKEKSRQNSYKHGLTGDGVVVGPEHLPETLRRFEALQEELKPSGEAGHILLRRFAYLSVRLERCEEFEAAAVDSRVRNAIAVFDDNRLTEIEGLIMHFESDPMTVTRRLQTSPEGLDWLIEHWGELRGDLMNADRSGWTLNHRSRLEQLLGKPGGNVRLTRPYALSQALSGHFTYLEPGDGAGLDDKERIEWARNELASIIDREVERLELLKAKFNRANIDRDRLEAPKRALFNASPELNLARKYEAATERAMYKALDQFHEVELAALEAAPIYANGVPEAPCEKEMGSFFPKSDLGLNPPPEPEGSTRQSVYQPEFREVGEFGATKKFARPVLVS